VIVDDWHDMAAALADADALEPDACRSWVEEHFSAERMTRDYAAAYEQVLAGVAA
jgi:hypothetical protein